MRFRLLLLLFLCGLAVVAMLVVYASRPPRPISLPQQGPEGDVWLFDFGPEAATPFPGFARVSGRTEYSGTRGYGWIDVEGDLDFGTFHDASLHWEAAENLNLVSRPGPDPLAAGFATGPAQFALDLPPGRYDVWVLTGDWGLLEYFLHEAYQILVEDHAIDVRGVSEAEFDRRFESPGADDTLSDSEAYDRYVAPLFRWEKITTSVQDGRLTVQVIAPTRPKSLLEKLGNYPWSDLKYGPAERFAGALNAMIVTVSDPRSTDRIERLESERRTDFRRRHPRKSTSRDSTQIGAPEIERGYSLFSVTTLEDVLPSTIRPHAALTVTQRATPGEYVPITFAIHPHRDLGEVRGVATDFTDEAGAVLEGASLAIGTVRYGASGDRKEGGWEPRASLIVPGDRPGLTPQVTKQFWLTLHVPDDAAPGRYVSSLALLPGTGAPARVELVLEVLPFSLRRPTQIATGLTYFVPIAYAYYDEERFWDRIQADFEDMRRHNMTTVQLTGVGLENYDDLDRLFGLYRNAGFEQPIYFLEAYTAIRYVTERYGYAEESEAFYERYVAIFRAFVEQAQRRSWPPVIVNFGDEFTNDARELFGAELARRLEQIPGIVTAADANGYKEVTLLAPHVSIVSINQGWSGPTNVNGDRTLLNAETIAQIEQAGAIPWLVNLGTDRFSHGAYLWKMIRLGVRGRIQWIYTTFGVWPHNPFDGEFGNGSGIALAGPAHSVLPTVQYERMRQGLDDLAYLHTLEELSRAAPPGAARDRAEAVIEGMDRTIEEDLASYSASDSDRWSTDYHEAMRDEVVGAILSLLESSPPLE